MKKYKIIYADPAWSYNDKLGNDVAWGGVNNEKTGYITQSKDWIKNLNVNNIADKDSVLFIWAVSPLLPDAFEVMRAWGFKYKTVAFVWSKETVNKKKVANMGRWTMGNVEMCLLGVKGKPKREIKNIRQLVEAERKRHSEKPDEVRKRIVKLMGDIPRIELFAREKKEGWDVWGNEVKNDIELK